MGQNSRKKRLERERRAREAGLGAHPQGQQGMEPDAPRRDDDVWPVHPNNLVQAMTFAMANRLPAARGELSDSEKLTLRTATFELDFPWQQFTGQLGDEVEFEEGGVVRRFRMPTAPEMFEFSSNLRAALALEGGAELAAITSVAPQCTPDTIAQRAAACVQGIRSLSPAVRFKVMREVRLHVSSLSLTQWAAQQIVIRREKEFAPILDKGANDSNSARLQSVLAAQRSQADRLMRELESQAPFWEALFAGVYFFIAMRPELPIAEYLPSPPRNIRAPANQEGEDFAAVLVPRPQHADDQAGGQDNAVEEPQVGDQGVEEFRPVLERLVPMADDDPFRDDPNLVAYVKAFGVMEVFRAVGAGLHNNTFAIALITTPEALSIRIVVCDLPEQERVRRHRSAYVFYASMGEKRRAEEKIQPDLGGQDDRFTEWTAPVTMDRRAARESDLFIFAARHRKVGEQRISHIRKIQRFLKTLTFRYK